jgi:hypothetical protein
MPLELDWSTSAYCILIPTIIVMKDWKTKNSVKSRFLKCPK